jgi:hypothetical protein
VKKQEINFVKNFLLNNWKYFLINSKTNLLFIDLMINETTEKYLGTEINGKCWKRYRKNKMFTRGDGKFYADDKMIYFHRLLTNDPISIDIKDITGYSMAKWHSGKWMMGYHVLKVNWQKDGLVLSSGFFLYKNELDIRSLINKLTNKSI